MNNLIYQIQKIPDLDLSKYGALDEGDVNGVLKKHEVFLRQLHSQAFSSNAIIHWIYEYNPDEKKGDRLKIYLKIDSDNINQYADNLIRHSPLSPYFDLVRVVPKEQVKAYREWLNKTDSSEYTRGEERQIIRLNSEIEYKYMAVLIKREKIAKADKQENGIFYSVNEWKINEDARLYDLFSMMQKMNKPCVYCVDVCAADYTNSIEERDSLGGAMAALRNMLTLRVEKTGTGTTFQRDESADYTLNRYKDFIKEIAANPHYRVNVRAYANDSVYAGMLLDTAASNALEEGAHDVIHQQGAYKLNDVINSSIYDYCTGIAPKELKFWPTLFTLKELMPFVVFPTLYSGESIEMPKETAPSYDSSGLYLGEDNDGFKVYIPLKNLPKHTFIAGVPGSGKTNSMLHIATELHNYRIPFLILEPAKQEYRALLNLKEMEDIIVFSPSSGTKFPLHINPFEFPKGMALAEHIRALLSVFDGAFHLDPPMPFLLDRAIETVYRDKGWIPTMINKGKLPYPTMKELYNTLEKILDKTDYEAEVKGNLKSVLQVRIRSLLTREMGDVFDVPDSTFSPEEWMLHSVVIELEAMGPGPSNFLTLMLATLIRETLKCNPLTSTEDKKKPRHVIFFEEAHNLIGPQAQEQAGQNADPKIAATAYIVKMLAEVRALNEAIIIADQLPTVMAPEVIKNTSLKIGHRITAQDDRALLGGTMSANEVQLERMAIFTTGKTLTTYEGLLKPFELQMAKWSDDENYISPSNELLFEKLYRSNAGLYIKVLEKSYNITISKFDAEIARINERKEELLNLADENNNNLQSLINIREKQNALMQTIDGHEHEILTLQKSEQQQVNVLNEGVQNVKNELYEIIDAYQDLLLRVRSYKEQNFAYQKELTEYGEKYCNEMLEVINEFEQMEYEYPQERITRFYERLRLWVHD